MIIATLGLIGSGKDTVASYIAKNHNYKQVAFADSLKRAVAEVFGWDFEMLQGHTKESREWREQVDPWWSERLAMPNLTPRWVLQSWGTEVARKSFHDDIWIASLEKKLIGESKNVVISDCRFPNELNMIRKLGGTVIRVERGAKPGWYDEAVGYLQAGVHPKNFPIHISEWAWLNEEADIVLKNDGTLDDLYNKVDKCLS